MASYCYNNNGSYVNCSHLYLLRYLQGSEFCAALRGFDLYVHKNYTFEGD